MTKGMHPIQTAMEALMQTRDKEKLKEAFRIVIAQTQIEAINHNDAIYQTGINPSTMVGQEIFEQWQRKMNQLNTVNDWLTSELRKIEQE